MAPKKYTHYLIQFHCPAKAGLERSSVTNCMGRLAQEELVDDIQDRVEGMNEDQVGPLPIQKLEVKLSLKHT